MERDDLRDDEDRGELSREGFSDADEKRNPIPPTTPGEPLHQEPETGRDRDPELPDQQ